MNGSVWTLSWRSLVRDWRSGDLWLLASSVVLAVAAMTTIGFFSDRLKSGLERDARQLLGGDAVVVSDEPLPPSFAGKAAELGLQSVQSLGFPTMARTTAEAGDMARLVSLKVVAAGYPLRGQLQLRDTPEGPTERIRAIPAPGTVWVDPALLLALEAKVSDTLLLGDRAFVISKIIAAEPDRGAGFSNFAPRVMMNTQDLAATGLVQPASRLTYRLALAAPDNLAGGVAPGVARYQEWVEAALANKASAELKGVRLESLQTGRPEMTQTLNRASSFLNLVALLAALLGAVALALAARNFANKHLDACAMLRVLGLPQRRIATLVGLEFVWVGLIACTVGVAIAFAVQMGLVALMGNLLMADLPNPTILPVMAGFVVGLVLLLAFGLTPVLQMASVPPLRVIRRDLGAPKVAVVASLGLALVGLSVLLVLAGNDIKLSAIVLGGFFAAAVLFYLLAYAAVRLMGRLKNRQWGRVWLAMALRQVCAKPATTALQVCSLSLGLLAVILLVLLRTDLVSSWRQSGSANAPDRFVINVMPDQGEAFKSALSKGQVQLMDWYPMIRGRLIQVNGKTVSPEDYTEDRAKRLVDREFNLSNSATLPAHNQLVAGKWADNEAGAISMEEGIAETLGLKLGDTLVFDIGGLQSTAKITSLRKVDWGSMRANFFALYPVAALPDVPQTYMGAFKTPLDASTRIDNQLVKAFPNITVIDMRQTIAQVQGVLNQVIMAVELLFSFSLVAGLLVVVTTVTSSREQRVREYAIMRALGASRLLLAKVQRLELALVGLLAGVLASVAANAIAWAMARFVFDFEWRLSLWAFVLGAVGGVVLAMVAGALALSGVVKRPVVQTLRQTAE
jgi:putative ABC transport system permease protein